MKKNLVFKLGLFCAALVLIATCFVSSAWAKYTNTVSATDSARVAKWTVSMTADSDETFTNESAFTLFDTAFQQIKLDTINKNASSEKIIAPGSSGQFEFIVNSTSEVSVKFDFTAVVTNVDNIPLKWTVKVDGTEVGALEDSLEDKLADANLYYSVNGANITSLDSTHDKVTAAAKITIDWVWDFESTPSNDTADTVLGTNGTALVSVKLTMVATQIDPSAA